MAFRLSRHSCRPQDLFSADQMAKATKHPQQGKVIDIADIQKMALIEIELAWLE